jgi:hypothetical protein
VESIRDQLKETGFTVSTDKSGKEQKGNSLLKLEAMFQRGEINAKDYLTDVGNLQKEANSRIQGVAESGHYKTVPKTRAEREAYYEKYGMPVPTWNAAQEMYWMYYDIKPQWEKDPETGVENYNWDKYFTQIDILMDALPASARADLTARIQAEWTDTQKLYFETNRTYLTPYNNVRNALIDTYGSQSGLLKKLASVTAGDAQVIRETLLAGSKDKTLVADFESKLSNIRENMRLLDPSLDAWLLFWGKTQKVLTVEAANIYNNDLIPKYAPKQTKIEFELN